MKRKHAGSALSQYMIILCLVALAITPMYLFFGNQIVTNLSNYVDNFDNINNHIARNINNVFTNIASNDANDTATNNSVNNDNTNDSVKQCVDNTCTITLGDFKLSGVPSDLNKIVETSGISGGIDKLVSLMNQIADQYKTQGKTQEAEDIKKLAITGHNMAVVQKSFENFIFNTCKADVTCIKSYANKFYPKPADFDETYSKFPTNIRYYDAPWITSVGSGVKATTADLVRSPEYALPMFYNNTFNQIKNNSNISDNVKGVIQELTWDIGKIADTWTVPFSYCLDYTSYNSSLPGTNDPLTGDWTQVNYDNLTASTAITQIQKVNVPALTHIDSGLICASGSYTDTGTSCH